MYSEIVNLWRTKLDYALSLILLVILAETVARARTKIVLHIFKKYEGPVSYTHLTLPTIA